MAFGQRLHARAGRARGGRAQGAGCGGRPLSPGQRRSRAGDGGHRGGAATRRRADEGVCAGGQRAGAGLALFQRPALPGKRPALPRAAARPVFLQFARGRVRELPGLWPRDWRGLGAGRARRAPDAARRGRQAHSNPGLERVPGRPGAPREKRGHSAGHALGAAHARAAPVGDRGRAPLQAGAVERAVVWHAALFSISGEQGLQDAHPCAALQIPQLHHVPGLLRRAPENRKPALARGQRRRCRCRPAARAALYAPRRGLDAPAARKPARAVSA